MPSGGHAQSGPPPDPNSLNSAKRGISYTALLPAEGYTGEAPAFPLPKILLFDSYVVDKQYHKEFDAAGTEARHERESELWQWVWRTPQAKAWSSEPWRWHSVAMWVRTAVVCESAGATAADKASLHRFADQIGMTPAGLVYNGWKIAPDEVGAKRVDKAPPPQANASSARDRMKLLRGAAAG